MNKTLKPNDLFDEPDDAQLITRAIDEQVIGEILHALGAREPTKHERQAKFIDSLPEDAVRSLRYLMTMYGAPSLEEMFTYSKPVELYEKIRNIQKLDLERIWSAWHNA